MGVVDGVFADATEKVLARYPEDEQARMLRAPGLRTTGRFYAFATPPGTCSTPGAVRHDLRGCPVRPMISGC